MHGSRFGFTDKRHNEINSLGKGDTLSIFKTCDDDHMDAAKDFTLNPVNHPKPKLLAFLDKIHAQGMKNIVLIDAGIAVNSSYRVDQRGMAEDGFISAKENLIRLKLIWPGPLYFLTT